MMKDTNTSQRVNGEARSSFTVSRRDFLKLGVAAVSALALGASLEKPLTAKADGACPANAIFYWVDQTITFEAWARPVELDPLWGEHFNVTLHRITDPDTNYLFNYHFQYDGIQQPFDDGNEYYVFQAFDDVSQTYLPDINLPIDNYSDNFGIAFNALNAHAYNLANMSRPVTGGNINLDDLETTIQNIAESSFSMAEGGLGLANDIFAQVVELLP